ncbi:putative pentatricopeptide repeat-containing protein At1g53330 [Phalaenopsis equestris]|uniref:putative pentatricopeptide repeat-containing protein At1g53330 n=1 Tax=Phalaenopsis equestris TaxID=78828 RepID=UPI0009E2793C|nr:putative pentatricopeptide repeat-containing protein At1g53330 [Phalaenopsis equestris]
MKKTVKVSPFRLTSLLRLEKNPTLALKLFRCPNPESNPHPSVKPFRYSARSFDIIICRLAQARMFTEMEQILDQMANQTRFTPKEALFCRIISFYGHARMPGASLRIFHQIPSFLCLQTIRSFNTLLDVLLRHGEIDALQALCNNLDATQFSPDPCTYNILIRAHAALGSIHGACELFDEMTKEGIRPTATTFGTLITALTSASMLDEAFRIKEEMLRRYNIKPNAYIYTSLVKVLCKNNELDHAIRLKDEIASDAEIGLDAAIYTTLIRAFFRAGRKGEVVSVLEEMKKKGVKPETATYNAIISGFCEEEDFNAAFEGLSEMKRRGCKPDVVSYNTIVMGMCRAGQWSEARKLFDDMPRRGCRPDVVTYRALLDGMCEAGEDGEMALLLEEMAFNGYYPAAMSFRKLLEAVLEKGGVGVGELVDWLTCVN